MPKFMDRHQMPGVTKAMAAEAHQQDLKLQGKHGVKFTRYWVDEKEGNVFCLIDAPNEQAALAVHKETGHPPGEIHEVIEGQ